MRPTFFHRFGTGPVWVLSLLFVLPGRLLAADPTAPADFSIGSSIVQPGHGSFGINLAYPYHNNWTRDPGMEPIATHMYGVATGGSASSLIADGSLDASFNGAFADGFFDGGQIRIYRTDGQSISLLRSDTVTAHDASAASGYRFELDGVGPTPQAGDVYFVETEMDNIPLGSVGPDVLAEVSTIDTWYPFGTDVSMTRDRSTQAPVEGGQSSLRLESPTVQAFGMGQLRYGPVDQFMDSLEPGRPYRMEAWLRQSDYNGGVTFEMDGVYSAVSFTTGSISGDWQRYTFDFTAPPRPQSGDAPIFQGLTFYGSGVVWIDNVRVFRTDVPAFEFEQARIPDLADSDPGIIRVFSGQSNEQLGMTLDDWTNPDSLAMRQYNPLYGSQYADTDLRLPTILPVAEQLGADPWLVVGVHHSEEDWHGLIDYLAGPGTNTFDAKRVAQGRVAPWADAFSRIYIEFGNEVWNPAFNWPIDAATYGQLAEHFFNVVQNHPHYPSLANKLVFVIGGQMDGGDLYHFGAEAMRHCPSADMLGVAPYIAGWEMDVDVTDFQDYLLFAPARLHYNAARHAATQMALFDEGVDYDLVTYESGPGYPLPTGEIPVQFGMEVYGKSLAGGVGTLDTLLGLQRMGYQPGNFFEFHGGTSYASHSAPGTGFNPHPAYLALQMANQFALNDRVSVAEHSSPTRDKPAENEYPELEVPLIDIHAYRDGDDYTIIVLSRELSASIPVTMRLPFDQAASVVLHTLAGDPTANNIDVLSITIEQQPFAFQGAVQTFDLPPGSIYVFAYAATSLSPSAAPSVVISIPYDQLSPTSDPSIRFQAHFSQSVSGFDTSDVVNTGSVAAPIALVEALPPYDGSAYEIAMSGMTADGVVNIAIPAGAAQSASGLGNVVSVDVNSAVSYDHLDTPALITPVDGSVLSGSTATFTWSGNDFQVDNWYLDIGSQPGWSNYLEGAYPGNVNSASVADLPVDGNPIFVTLFYVIDGQWDMETYEVTAFEAAAPSVTDPIAGGTLSGSDVQFQWSANGHAVEEWWLDVGTQHDWSDLHEGAYLGSQTSTLVTGLPTDGATLHVRLWYRIGWWWDFVDSTVQAAGTSP